MGTCVDKNTIKLTVFDEPWEEADPDANLKSDIAIYSREDPMVTISTISRNKSIPVGAIVRYILAKWAASGSGAILEMGPRVAQQMADIVAHAEDIDTDQERLKAYQKLCQIVSWLNVPLTDPRWQSGHTGGQEVSESELRGRI